MVQYCFGADVGGTTVKLGLFNEAGIVIDKWEIPTRSKENKILEDVAEAVLSKMEEKQITKDQVLGIGLGVPGPVGRDGVVNKAVNLGCNDKVPVAQILSDMTGLKVKAGNDANVAALGEMWKGGGEGASNIVMFTLGTGVGGGIIINGSIVTGYHGAGGEVGHLHVEDDEKDCCGCGNQGCLEQYASATGVVRVAKKILVSCDTPSVLRKDDITAKDVFDAVKAGDEVAKQVAAQFGKYLGGAIANVCAVVDPEVIVIGGGVSKAGEVLLDYIKEGFKAHVFHGCAGVQFALATLGNDAGIYGGAKLVLE